MTSATSHEQRRGSQGRRRARLEAELAQLTLAAGKAPSRAAWRILTLAAERLGFDSVAQANWCGRFAQVLRLARSLVRDSPPLDVPPAIDYGQASGNLLLD